MKKKLKEHLKEKNSSSFSNPKEQWQQLAHNLIMKSLQDTHHLGVVREERIVGKPLDYLI